MACGQMQARSPSDDEIPVQVARAAIGLEPVDDTRRQTGLSRQRIDFRRIERMAIAEHVLGFLPAEQVVATLELPRRKTPGGKRGKATCMGCSRAVGQLGAVQELLKREGEEAAWRHASGKHPQQTHPVIPAGHMVHEAEATHKVARRHVERALDAAIEQGIHDIGFAIFDWRRRIVHE